MRRAHPFVLIAIWAVVTLLAVAGFAAFQIRGRPAPQPIAADIGRETGALAGLGFNATSLDATAAVETQDPPQTEAADPATDVNETDPETDDDPPEITSADTVPTHGWLSEVQVRTLVSRYFDEEDVNRAIRVAWCESRFNPTSTNLETGGTGLFHHLPEFWEQRVEAAGFPGAEPTDVEANVAAAAYAVYEEGGWAVFNCAP